MTFRKLIVLVVLTLTGCSPVVWTHGVPDLHQVEPGLYRGGEPTTEGWNYLQSLGVNVDIQLDYDNERPVNVVPPPTVEVRRFTMPPSDTDDILRGPRVAELVAAANAIASARATSRVVYVHCKHGHDRTGGVVATYRHVNEHQSKVDAFAEARKLGFHIELLGLVRAWDELP